MMIYKNTPQFMRSLPALPVFTKISIVNRNVLNSKTGKGVHQIVQGV
jgi:hypothetical protein